MRSIRTLAVVGLLLLGTSGCASTTASLKARQQAVQTGIWVEVNPSNATAGFKVTVRADCGDNTNAATVTSAAFGTLSVQPSNTLLLAEVTVPQTTKPGTFEVKLTCRTGATASTTLTIIAGQQPVATIQPPGPHTGGGFLASGGGNSGWTDGPALWLIGSAVALAAAATLGAVSVRRRRRVRVR